MAGGWRSKARGEISSSGYVVSTLEAAIWSVGTTATFEEAVLLAANLGDDADTVAAVTGQLAGALYGRAGIPERWLTMLAWRDRIEDLAQRLLMAGERDRLGRARFSWNDGDVVFRDADGEIITPDHPQRRQRMPKRPRRR